MGANAREFSMTLGFHIEDRLHHLTKVSGNGGRLHTDALSLANQPAIEG
jgi:hypothetical protein